MDVDQTSSNARSLEPGGACGLLSVGGSFGSSHWLDCTFPHYMGSWGDEASTQEDIDKVYVTEAEDDPAQPRVAKRMLQDTFPAYTQTPFLPDAGVGDHEQLATMLGKRRSMLDIELPWPKHRRLRLEHLQTLTCGDQAFPKRLASSLAESLFAKRHCLGISFHPQLCFKPQDVQELK